METLQIMNTQTTVNAQQIIAGNTANYHWNFDNLVKPKMVSFSVKRGIIGGEEPFLGNNVISGTYYKETNKLDIQNNSFTDGDFEIYAEILVTCKQITEPELT